MKKIERRQLQLVCNRFQKNIMYCIASVVLLTVLFFVGGFLWIYLNLREWTQEMIPLEVVLLRFNQSVLILACLIPLILIVSWILSWRVTYRTVGALERINLELQRRIQNGETKPIKVRRKDGIRELVEKINHLLKTSKTD